MKTVRHTYDVVVVGGGLTGMCAAVTAARKGVRVALVQDRPVLGGNASKEIRVPPVGAANCNFAYSRETGLVEELYLNNLHRNPTWSWEGWNIEYETLIRNESNIDLFLNTAACEVTMAGSRIESVKALCAPAETWHLFHAPIFMDCSGDGVVGALSGAVHRVGVEARSEFGEDECPEEATHETMGNSLQLRARDAGRPVPFTLPAWVDKQINAEDFGPYRPVCKGFFPDTGGFWWLEWGGALDTIHQSELIKDEVQKILLGVWDFLKNRSELAEQLATYELEWVGSVSGKRESRRFEGDHILTVGDIDAQSHFDDAIAYGGWGIDHHPPGGFYDKNEASTHRYLGGPHNIPLRCLYSKNIENLFVAGRNLSATHYALSSTRVMLTCAQLGEGAGMAAAYAVKEKKLPRQLVQSTTIHTIQQDLVLNDHHLHAFPVDLPGNIALQAKVTASSVFSDRDETASWGIETLTEQRVLKLPLVTQQLEHIAVLLDAAETTRLHYTLFNGPENRSTYPDEVVFHGSLDVAAGRQQWCDLECAVSINRPGWHFLVFDENPDVAVHLAEVPTGLRRYYPRPEDPIRPNPFCDLTARTSPIGRAKSMDVDGAAVPVPEWNEFARQHADQSAFLNFGYLVRTTPEQPVYLPQEVVSPDSRPVHTPGLWVSAATDFSKPEWLALSWDSAQTVSRIQLLFDSSLHFHFWQGWSGYPLNALPSLVRDYRIIAEHSDGSETLLVEEAGNYLRNRTHRVEVDDVKRLRIEITGTNGIPRAQLYTVRVF